MTCCEGHKDGHSGHKHENVKETRGGKEAPTSLIGILIVVAALLLVFNQYQISGVQKAISLGALSGQESTAAQTIVTGASVIPTGTPAIYGSELKIKYDDISPSNAKKADATISALGNYDKTIKLSGPALGRYVKIAGSISCEYCCGAASIIFTKDQGGYKAGDAACGCAHSFAMRGLAKYLLTKHPDISDDAVLEELGKWKTLFFPGIMQQKADIMRSQGIEMNYINLASNKYRGIEKGVQGGSMVGGC